MKKHIGGKLCSSLVIAVLLAGPAMSQFVEPHDGPVPFRRDRVALDAWTLSNMAKQLEVLAASMPVDSSSQRRALAQTLALAGVLDPANPGVNEQIQALKQSRPRSIPDTKVLVNSRTRLWQWITWLESPEAGSQSQALAFCLKDVMAQADPDHANAKSLQSSGPSNSWEGWIPPVADYEIKPPTPPPSVEENPPDSGNTGISPLPEQVLLPKASVGAVQWKRSLQDNRYEWSYVLAPLDMTARAIPPEMHGGQAFDIILGDGGGYGQSTTTIGKLLSNLLSRSHSPLPKGVRIRITSRELEQSIAANRRISISAAAAVLANAAITNSEPDAIVIGQVDETGTYQLPIGIWEQLQSLGKGTNRRLILPVTAEPYLLALLALEKPEFFMEYEVILAKNFEELVMLSAKDLPDAQNATALKFAEIRDRAANRDLRSYIGNPFIRQRLADLSQAAPYHASGKMLLIQASGQRPTTLPRKVFASEVRRALQPMAWLAENTGNWINPEDYPKLSATYETCDTLTDALERYCERNERPLFEQTREVISDLRSVDRATRARGETYVANNKLRIAKQQWLNSYLKLSSKLSEELEDSSRINK